MKIYTEQQLVDLINYTFGCGESVITSEEILQSFEVLEEDNLIDIGKLEQWAIKEGIMKLRFKDLIEEFKTKDDRETSNT